MNLTKSYAAALLALGMAAAACSDNEPGTGLSFDSAAATECMMEGDDYSGEFAFIAEGRWSAKVVYDNDDHGEWLALIGHTGDGNATLPYVTGPNTGIDMRVARIVVASGDNELIYTVRQKPENFDINDASTDPSLFSSQVPLGFGLEIAAKKNKLIKNQIFRLNTIKSLEAYAGEYFLSPETYVTSAESSESVSEILTRTDLENQSRDINANLKVNVAYGLFKLGLNGTFKMFGSDTLNSHNYGVVATHPAGTHYLDADMVLFDYSTLEEGLKTAGHEDSVKIALAQNLIFTPNFKKIHDGLEAAVTSGDSAGIKSQILLLDKFFGPAYISRVDVGGTAELNYTYTAETASDVLKIHGDLSLGINALLCLDASASADYENNMRQAIKTSTLTSRIKGGTKESRKALNDAFIDMITTANDTNPVTFNKIMDAINSWYDSIEMNTPGTITCSTYYPEPVWNLFSEEAQVHIRKYFKTKYANRPDGTCPYSFDIEAMADAY